MSRFIITHNGYRCGECPNCKELERLKHRVLACCNPPFNHADDDVVQLWNRELARLPCTKESIGCGGQ
jgi:hypothetical protein